MSLASGSNAGVLRKRAPPTGIDRKIKENPRYKNVQATLDTGSTVKKKHVPTTREVSKRREEIFKRLRPMDLYAMIVEFEESKEVPEGVGPHIVTVPATADNETNKPFLLLDAREKEEFDRCHLMDAINFPVILLNRDKIDYQIMRYKNKEGCSIVVYDDRETVAPSLAGRLVERGYENVFMLTGGLRAMAKKYPLVIDGEIPEELTAPAEDSPRGVASSARTNSRTPASTARQNSSRGTGAMRESSLRPSGKALAKEKLVDRINETPQSKVVAGGKIPGSRSETQHAGKSNRFL